MAQGESYSVFTLSREYHINIFFSQEDDGYIADIPDLGACSAFGETPTDALAQLQIAKVAWLDAASAAGKPIPQPRYRPVIYQASSYGQMARVSHG